MFILLERELTEELDTIEEQIEVELELLATIIAIHMSNCTNVKPKRLNETLRH